MIRCRHLQWPQAEAIDVLRCQAKRPA